MEICIKKRGFMKDPCGEGIFISIEILVAIITYCIVCFNFFNYAISCKFLQTKLHTFILFIVSFVIVFACLDVCGREYFLNFKMRSQTYLSHSFITKAINRRNTHRNKRKTHLRAVFFARFVSSFRVISSFLVRWALENHCESQLALSRSWLIS